MGDDEEAPVYEIQFEGEEDKLKFVAKEGRATAHFPNGDAYVGAYKQQQRWGKGTYTFATGQASYEGDYVEGKV